MWLQKDNRNDSCGDRNVPSGDCVSANTPPVTVDCSFATCYRQGKLEKYTPSLFLLCKWPIISKSNVQLK